MQYFASHNAKSLSDDAIAKDWEGPSGPSLSDQDIKKDWEGPQNLGPTQTATSGGTPGPYGLLWDKDPLTGALTNGRDPNTGELILGGKPFTQPPTSQAVAGLTGTVSGLPIVGPPSLAGVQAGAAGLSALTGGTPYGQNLQSMQDITTASQQAYPKTTSAGNVAGGVLGTLPMMVAAPTAFGLGQGSLLTRSLLSGMSGTGVNAADAYVRSGFDPKAALQGGATGGLFGVAAPGVGQLVGAGVRGIVNNVVSRAAPLATGTYGTELMNALGITPESVQNLRGQMGPAAVPADISPAATTEAVGLAKTGGPEATNILKKAMEERNAASDGRMHDIIDQTLGPEPNGQAIVNDIKSRNLSNKVDTQTATAALDSAIGSPVSPYSQFAQRNALRSAAAKPLYKEALDIPIVWDKELQGFLDRPEVKEGFPLGLKQESLDAFNEGRPFDASDYVSKGRGVANDPQTGRFVSAKIMGETPNMKILNVAKMGLDAQIAEHTDQFGRLDMFGRSLSILRNDFLKKLDFINPVYKDARNAWAGPTQNFEGFNRGLHIFGKEDIPGEFEAWAKNPTTTDSEKGSAILGLRAAFEQQMAAAPDSASKATALAGNRVFQQKAAALLGPDRAQQLVDQLTFKYEDPIGQAFDKGLHIGRYREGLNGIEDSPQALEAWKQAASPEELAAHQAGARIAVARAMEAARDGNIAGARSMFAKGAATRAKMESTFPGAQDAFDGLDNEMKMRENANKILHGSQTADAQAVEQRYPIRDVSPLSSPGIVGPLAMAAAEGGAILSGHPIWGALGIGATALARRGAQMLGQHADVARNAITAKLLSDPDAFLDQILKAQRFGTGVNVLSNRGSAAANLLTRTLGPNPNVNPLVAR
jgi:hypothetical protein